MMTFNPPSFISKLVVPWTAGLPVPVYYVTDNAKWSFHWDAQYITNELNRVANIETEVTRKPWRLRGKIIHFGDRYCFFNGPTDRLAARNTLFLTWFHGQRDDPAMAPLFEQLLQQQGNIERIVTTCSMSHDELVATGVEAERIATIPLGIDLERFRPCGVDRKLAIRRDLGIPRDALCVGSFQKDGAGWDTGDEPKMVKGPDVFLETMRRLANEFDNLFVLLTGPARGYVKQGLTKIGIPYLHRQLDKYWDLIPFYQALDLYIIASRCEGGPKALLETWAVGVPLVSTRVGMPADLVKHGINGGLAEVEDAEGLAEAAAEMCLDPNYRHRCCRQALVEVQDFRWSIIAGAYYEQLYAPHLKTRHHAGSQRQSA